MFSSIFYLAQIYPLWITILRCLDNFGKLQVRHPVFPKRKPTFSVFFVQSRPMELHHFHLVASKAILGIPILAGMKEKDWKSRIIKFLSSMRCRNYTHHFCLNPINESLVTWPLLIKREAEKCNPCCGPSTILSLWKKGTHGGYLAVSATDMFI